jgi:hypothetical protein
MVPWILLGLALFLTVVWGLELHEHRKRKKDQG